MTIGRMLHIAMGGIALALLVGFTSTSANAAPPKTKWTARQAEGAVLMKYKTGKVQGKTALENEDKKWQYAVIVKVDGKLHEVMVDANTGKITSEETVTPKEEAAEKKAEAAKHGKTTKPGKGANAAKAEEKEGDEKDEKAEKKK